MNIDLKNFNDLALPDTQICIIGGGVAGIVLANELSKKTDKKIVILESGSETFDMDTQKLYQAESFPTNFPDPMYSRLRFLGGTSNHWQNNTSPLSPVDFEKRSGVKNSGWPISYEHIEPYYNKAALYCGTGNDGYEEKYWENKLSVQDLVKKSNKIQTKVAKMSTPPVRFFNQFREELNQADNLTIYSNATVTDIEFDASEQKIKKVYMNSSPNKKHSINADVFIMCLGGIENARVLLTFNNKYSNQLGNQGDSVGRYFMDHPVVRAAHIHAKTEKNYNFYTRGAESNSDRIIKGYFQLSEQIIKYHKLSNIRVPLIPENYYTLSDGISSYHSIANALSDFSVPDNFFEHVYNVFSDFDLVTEAILRKKFDTEFVDRAKEFGGFETQIMIEQTPERRNRIRLSDSKDAYGMNKIHIDWSISQKDKDNLWKALEVLAIEMGVLDIGRVRLLKEREDQIWSNLLGFGNHHMGTTRMSDSPKTGVVDSNQKVFGCENLFIGGSSVFSTGGHVPPTLTIVAMTIRLSEHLLNEFNYG